MALKEVFENIEHYAPCPVDEGVDRTDRTSSMLPPEHSDESYLCNTHDAIKVRVVAPKDDFESRHNGSFYEVPLKIGQPVTIQ